MGKFMVYLDDETEEYLNALGRGKKSQFIREAILFYKENRDKTSLSRIEKKLDKILAILSKNEKPEGKSEEDERIKSSVINMLGKI